MTKPSKSRSGGSKARQLKLNPTTLAVRRAMALGLGLALASATPAFAACDTQLANLVECQQAAAGAGALAVVDDPSWVLPATGGQFAAVKAEGVAPITKAYDVGLVAYGDFVHVENADTITANVDVASGYASAYGAYISATDVARLDNSGDISASATSAGFTASAYGALVFGTFSGIAVISNQGTISAEAQAAYGASATGAFAIGNVATVVNDGDIDAHASALYDVARATAAHAYGLWTAVYNYGDLAAEASAEYGQAQATGAESYGYFGSSIVNEGDITAVADAFAGTATAIGAQSSIGVYGYGSYVDNSGSIEATASAHYGTATAIGAQSSIGVYGYGSYLDNSGSIEATASAHYGSAIAAGAANFTTYLGSAVTTNAGDINARADAYAGYATAFGVYNYAFIYDSQIVNSGAISSSAQANGGGTAQAAGAMSQGLIYSDAGVVNAGDIMASAEASYGTAIAIGAEAYGAFLSVGSVQNSGSISASADAYYGEAVAWGSRAIAAYADVDNTGDISAAATADFGEALAVGAYAFSKYSAQVVNEGSIDASASAASGTARAFGVSVNSTYYESIVVNDGSISATVYGDDGLAVGVSATSVYGDVIVANGGDISAIGEGGVGAIAVNMYSYGTNTLVNTGDISADSESSYAVAVLSSTYATALIYNEGSISGAIQTGDLDDLLDNSGSWTASGLSHFGGGDDVIANSGSILINGAIDLGGYAATGNVFENSGELLVRGSGNWIDMGAGNPLAFDNTGGDISFVDGAANDSLTLYGNFAGNGSLAFDFDGQSGLSDVFYIDGDVAAGSVTTVNGQLLSPVTSASSVIGAIVVSGNSSASNFVVGTISTPVDSFFSFDFQLLDDLDASNATADVFALGVEVSGLSARGELSGALVPGVQNLWHAATGTLVQREGALRQRSGSGFDVWLRGFSSDGDIAPGAGTRNFGAGGNQVFEQQSSGIEAGLSYHVHEGFSVGLLFGRADADLDPASGGSASLDADTVGGYATFTHGDFYIDASLRRMDIDIEGAADGVAVLSASEANGFSLESGYAFEVGEGLRITPQLQYSSLDVDDVVVEGSWGDFIAADNDSRRTRLGVSFDKTFDEGNGRSWTPFLSLSAVRESAADNGYVIDGVFTGDSRIDGDSTLLETGISSHFGNWSLFGSLHWQDGDALDSVFGGQLALRYNFGGGQ
ncbi:MAG TPA: autotransporter outer membrane beta-barrel domain-containing protein [Arenimonas sp.]|nr:autotransporter outer membrane beta-barrel domain-containing protein [Arenimonas sp.]